MNNKTSIRKRKLRERNSVSAEERKLSKGALTTTFAKSTRAFKLNNVGIYFSIKNEAPTSGIIEYIEELGIECYLPIISNDSNLKVMRFSKYKKDNKLRNNKFGIPEPLDSTFIDLDSIDLFLLPLLAFDNRGYRIGMGMGYYDSTLLRHNSYKENKIWGVAYEFQEEENCYPKSHDLKLDAVLCPNGLREF